MLEWLKDLFRPAPTPHVPHQRDLFDPASGILYKAMPPGMRQEQFGEHHNKTAKHTEAQHNIMCRVIRANNDHVTRDYGRAGVVDETVAGARMLSARDMRLAQEMLDVKVDDPNVKVEYIKAGPACELYDPLAWGWRVETIKHPDGTVDVNTEAVRKSELPAHVLRTNTGV